MNDNEVKILITGDFCPHNRVEDLVLRSEYHGIFENFMDVLHENDLNITDLECPLTLNNSSRIKTGPHQKAHPDCVKLLKQANFNLVALANNHIMDYSSIGANDTIELCKANGIDIVGIGRSPEEARKPYSIVIKKKRYAILNFADNEFISTPDGAFICNTLNSVQCFYDISEARLHHDYLIVLIHAGNEFYELPSPRTKMLYRYLIDIGADVIVSHHTHAFSGFEIYKSKPIFYGLGNFIYDWPGKINSNWNKGYVVRLTISEKTEFEIIPLKQCNEIPGVFHLSSVEKELFDEELKKLSAIIGDEEKLETEFMNYCKSVYPMYDAFIEPNFGKYITALRKRGMFPKLMSKRKRLLLLNISRCDSHRDVLLRMLKHYE